MTRHRGRLEPLDLEAVHVPGEFGVRIEDLVVGTEDGATRLNHTHRGYEPTAEG